MENLIMALAIALVTIWLWSRRGASTTVSQPQQSPLPEPKITFSVHMTAAHANDKTDTGPVTATSGSRWVLNPRTPLPVTVSGVDSETLRRLKGHLEEAFSLGQYNAARSILTIIARSNLRWLELDNYVGKYKSQYTKQIEDLKRTSPDWPSASEKDKEDLLTSFRQQAINSLDVRPYCDLEVLFEQEPADVTIDDALIDRYGLENLKLYLRHAGNPSKVRVVPADAPERTVFEKLVELGLARRGSEIPLPAVLETLKRQDLNNMAADFPRKPFGRKAKAIEFLMSLPDLRERVSKMVALRELFQMNTLPSEFSSIDLTQLSIAWRYAAEVAELMTHTYVMGGYSVRDRTRYRDGLDFIKGWELLPAQDACPYCKRAAARTYPRNQMPSVPLHIGCRCTVITVVID